MKKGLILLLFILSVSAAFGQKRSDSTLSFNVSRCYDAQTLRDTANRILIKGRILLAGTNEPISGADMGIRGTKRAATANEFGEYCLDITDIADTTRSYDLVAVFINCEIAEILITEKIDKTRNVNFSLKERPGVSCPVESPKKTKRKIREK